jgi:branched-chain amino acid transport system permease protein
VKLAVLFLALGAAALAVPFYGTEYALSFTIQLLVFMVLAYSWNLIGGYAGYTHFGQVCFFGVGGYTGALLVQTLGIPWYYAVPLAGLAGIVLAAPLGAAMLRLKGPYFAIGMFGLTRVMESLVLGFDSVTKGGTGLYLPPLDNLKPVYFTLVGLAVIVMLATWRLDNSRLGLKLLAIREDEQAADALGLRTTPLKIGTFIVSAIAPAIVGALNAVYLAFIDPPTAFSPVTELTTIAIVLLGGMGTVLGPLVGAIVLSVVNELLWARFPESYLAIVGTLVLLGVLFMPRGIVNLAMKKGWLPAGRGMLRQLAREQRRDAPAAVVAAPIVTEDVKGAGA